MVDCGCATPDEAFEGLEEDNDLGSAEERRALVDGDGQDG